MGENVRIDASEGIGSIISHLRRGESVTLTDHGHDLAYITPVVSASSDEIRERRIRAIDNLERLRRSNPHPMSVEEIVAITREDRDRDG